MQSKFSFLNALESQSQYFNVHWGKKQQLTEEEKKQTASIYYHDIFGTLEVQRRVTIYMARVLEIQEDLLEKSSFMGPVSTVTLYMLHFRFTRLQE